MNYQKLQELLKLDVSLQWMITDSRDDFFPDPLQFRDIEKYAAEYLNRWKHRILQVDATSWLMGKVPKKGGMLREALWLHPVHRILYLACLHHFIDRIDSKLSSQAYSYRADNRATKDDYPFKNTMSSWLQFHNDFRDAAMSTDAGAVLITDIAAYYDHIECTRLCETIRSILSRSFEKDDEVVLELLSSLLKMWSTFGYGIPQNLDASSFFGSMYLHCVDTEMVDRRYRYFRYVDDIRIVAKNREQALRALHDLQNVLARQRLFLATNKTRIVEKSDSQYFALMDATDDLLISEFDSIKRSADKKLITDKIGPLLDRLNYHAGEHGEDRKFRAFANRLLDCSEYEELGAMIFPKVIPLVIAKFRRCPERSDYWSRMLANCIDESVLSAAEELLCSPPSLYDWQRFYLWKLLTCFKGTLSDKLSEAAMAAASNAVFPLVGAQALVCAGKSSDDVKRELIFGRFFNSQQPYVVQRAVLIGIQELPTAIREKLYRRAVEVNSDHTELVNHLEKLDAPNYGDRVRPKRDFKDTPIPTTPGTSIAVGMIDGKVVRYHVGGGQYDYGD